MPDDRELADTHGAGRLLADPVPGLAAVDELVVSRQSETLPSDDILVRKPLGLLFWLALGWVGLVVILALIANLLPLASGIREVPADRLLDLFTAAQEQ